MENNVKKYIEGKMVKLKNCNIIEFAELIIGKKLFCFGSGRQAEGFFSSIGN